MQVSESMAGGEDPEDDADEQEEGEGVDNSQTVRQSNGLQARVPASMPPLPTEPHAAFDWVSTSWKRDLVRSSHHALASPHKLF